MVITSLKDDVGYDTNGDGGASRGAAGDWNQLSLSGASGSIVLDHATVRFGGYYFSGYTNHGMIYAGAGSLTIRDSLISDSGANQAYGAITAKMAGTQLSVSGSMISNNRGPGILINSATAMITDNIIDSNDYGLYISGVSPDVRNNCISDNTVYGAYNSSSTVISLGQNYWGSPNGPGPMGVNSTIDLGGAWLFSCPDTAGPS